MTVFTLDELQEIVRDTIGNSGIILDPGKDSTSVAGWDSLQHTIIVMEINDRHGLAMSAAEAAARPTFAALVTLVNGKLQQS